MRILHVTQRYLPAIGGSELHFAELSSRLAADGHAVTVVTTDALDFELFWNRRARRIAEPESIIDGVRVLRFPVRHLPAPQLSYPAMRRLLWLLTRSAATPVTWVKWLARFTPWAPALLDWLANTTEEFDLVAGMTIVFEPLLAAAQHYARQHHRPFVVYPLTHLGVGAEPGRDAISRFYTMRHQVDIVTNSDFLIANSADEADFYRARGLAPTRIAVVGPGVELSRLAGGNGVRLRAQYGLTGTVVGVISALTYDKGVVHVVEAVRSLWRAGCAVQLVLAGTILTQFQSYLATLPPTERSRILMLGAVDHQTKLDLLDAIDILALPSRTDSFGIVFLEAWAYGKPVIGAQAWGIRTVINDGIDGLLVPFGDVARLANAIRTLADDPALRQRLGEAGRRKVHSQHTWDHKYPLVRQIYMQLCQEASRSR